MDLLFWDCAATGRDGGPCRPGIEYRARDGQRVHPWWPAGFLLAESPTAPQGRARWLPAEPGSQWQVVNSAEPGESFDEIQIASDGRGSRQSSPRMSPP